MRTLKNLLLYIIVVLIYDNSQATIIDTRHQFAILEDLKIIPQKAESVINNFDQTKPLNNLQFKKEFFEVWLNPLRSKKTIDYSLKIAENHAKKILNNFYGLHYNPYNPELTKKILNNLQYNNQIFRSAIITKNSNLGIVPSDLPFFNLEHPEEYYPFNSNQNSYLTIGTPIIILNFSKDRAYALIYSNEKSIGWIKIENFAFINSHQINHYLQKELLIITEDYLPLYDHKKKFHSYQNYGVILAIHKNYNSYYEALMPVADKNHHLKWKNIDIQKNQARKLPLAFNKENLTYVIDKLLDKPYGWGSIYGFRDCSALVRAYFYSFGIFLPRNSEGQSKIASGKIIEIGNLTNEEKINMIKKNAKAFRTLIYMPGHIGIYIGLFNNEPLMLHSIWAIRIMENNIEGRNIIGKSVISTLKLGIELDNLLDKKTLIDKINKIIIL